MKVNTYVIFVSTCTMFKMIFNTCVNCDFISEYDLGDNICTGETCTEEETLKHEKMKYYIEKAREFHALQKDSEEEMTEEELKHILRGFREKTIDIENIGKDSDEIEEITNDNSDKDKTIDVENVQGKDSNEIEEMIDNDTDTVEPNEDVYEFPRLTVLDPGIVGDSRNVELEEGRLFNMITRSIQPPVFEIPNFLSDDECNYIIDSALKAGLNISNIFGSDIDEEFAEDLDLSEISRVSEQTWLREENLGSDFWSKLLLRVSKLTGLPFEHVRRGEPIQVVSYAPGGHYHAHLDTVDFADHLPCCFQTDCGDKEHTPEWAECCRLCRFITVLYYLNEPEDGGETAFPIADMPDELVEEKFVNLDDQEWYNLSHYCYNSSLIVKPKRGTAIMWYSHFLDEQTGYLGKVDRRSHHGGCDLKKGSKWIANTWISGTTYEDRFKPSKFYKEAD